MSFMLHEHSVIDLCILLIMHDFIYIYGDYIYIYVLITDIYLSGEKSCHLRLPVTTGRDVVFGLIKGD